MRWIETPDSSTIAAIRYDPRTALLDIRFTNDRVYRYEGVPEFVYRALLRADSKGRYFNEIVRNGYGFEELA